MKKLKPETIVKIKKGFIYCLPPVLFFSYYPVLTVGQDATMNLEFSLPLIWLLLFAVLSLPAAWRFVKERNISLLFCSIVLPIFATLSILWSLNRLRGVLTAGVLWCIWIAVVGFYDLIKNSSILKDKKFVPTLIRSLLISTVVVCGVCWVQSILDLVGVQREVTLMCLGCRTITFGFPHPNGFAIEPQFMGNLLLFPTLLTLSLFVNAKEKKQKILYGLCSLLFVMTLFLTFSRGAIYAFGVSVIVYLLVRLIKKRTFSDFVILPMILAAFIFTLCMQGVFAAVSVTNDTFSTGVARAVSQLSLGVVDFTDEVTTEVVEVETGGVVEETSVTESTFDGYVEESTNTRTSLSTTALAAWVEKPTTFIFGYGLGSAGKVLNAFLGGNGSDKEITQNELMEVALELGLVGVVLVAMLGVGIVKVVLKTEVSAFFLSVLCAFGLSMLFFSGLPNALHIFLLPPLFFFIFKDKTVVNKVAKYHS